MFLLFIIISCTLVTMAINQKATRGIFFCECARRKLTRHGQSRLHFTSENAPNDLKRNSLGLLDSSLERKTEKMTRIFINIVQFPYT